MKIKEKIEGDVAILEISGKLMGGPETQQLHDHIKGLIADNVNKVIINLSKVKWMNSSGLGILIGAVTVLKNSNGILCLINVSDRIKNLLKITKLDTVFEIYDNFDEAAVAIN